MKKLIIFLFPLLLMSCANTDIIEQKQTFRQENQELSAEQQKYYDKIKQCDTDAERKSNLPEYYNTNGDMRRLIYEQIDCYKNIAENIINEKYFQNKTEMLENLNNFLANSRDVSYDIHFPDSCNPDCGTIARLDALGSELEIVKSYLDILIKQQNPIRY